MSDYISREAARPDAFCEGVSCQECPFCKDPIKGGCRVDDYIKAIPAADVVEVVHGRWEIHAYGIDGEDVYCSVCGNGLNLPYWNYCPNCGAKMDGGDGDA